MARTTFCHCFLRKALGDRSVALGKKSCGRAGAYWALLSQALCSRPGFKLPRRNKQTQPPPCSSVRGLGWHSMLTTISWHRRGLAFCSGAKADSGTRSVPFPQERRGDRILAHCPCTGMGSCGVCLHSFGHPVPPRMLPHPGGGRHLTASSSWSCFCEFRAGHLVASPCLPSGQVAHELLSPWPQRHRTGLPSA